MSTQNVLRTPNSRKRKNSATAPDASGRPPKRFRMESQEMWDATFEEIVSLVKSGYSLRGVQGASNALQEAMRGNVDIYVGYDHVERVVHLDVWPIDVDDTQ